MRLPAGRGQHLDQLFLGAAHVAQTILQDRAQAMARQQSFRSPGLGGSAAISFRNASAAPFQSCVSSEMRASPVQRARMRRLVARHLGERFPQLVGIVVRELVLVVQDLDVAVPVALALVEILEQRQRAAVGGREVQRRARRVGRLVGHAQAALVPERDLHPQIRRLLRIFQARRDLGRDRDQLLPAAAAAGDALHLLHDAPARRVLLERRLQRDQRAVRIAEAAFVDLRHAAQHVRPLGDRRRRLRLGQQLLDARGPILPR